MAERLEIIIDVNTKDGSPKVQKLQGDLKQLGQAAKQTDDVIAAGLNPSLSSFASLAAVGGPVTIALAAAVAILAAGMVGLAFSIKEAAEAEKVMAQTAAVLRSTGEAAGMSAEQVSDLAQELSALSGVSDETIQSAENMLLTFTEIKGKVFPQAAAAALDLSTAFGMDLNNATIMLGKALQDPIQGLTALRRVGVSFTESQTQMIQRMAEGGRVMQAQTLILRELSRQTGGSAEALGGTMSGEWNKIKNLVGNAAEEIGGIFLPMIGSELANVGAVMSGVFKGMEPALKALQSAMKDLDKAFQSREGREALEQLGEVMGHALGGGMVEAVQLITDGVKGFADLWAEHGPEIIDTITRIGESLATVAGFIADIKAGMDILGQLGGLAAMNMPGFANGVQGFSGGMAMVGERGPEPVFLPRGSTVVSNQEARAALSGAGGGGPTIHIGNLNVTQERGATLTDLLRGARVLQGLGNT